LTTNSFKQRQPDGKLKAREIEWSEEVENEAQAKRGRQLQRAEIQTRKNEEFQALTNRLSASKEKFSSWRIASSS
jgi:hypothetical protein